MKTATSYNEKIKKKKMEKSERKTLNRDIVTIQTHMIVV